MSVLSCSVMTFLVTLLTIAGVSAHAITPVELNTYLSKDDKCLGSMLDRYIWVQGKDEDWKNRSLIHRYETAEKLYKVQSEKGFKTLMNGAWDRALVPTLEAQMDVIFDSLLVINTSGDFVTGIEMNVQGELSKLPAVEQYLRVSEPKKHESYADLLAKAFGAEKKTADELFALETKDEDYLKEIKDKSLIFLACGQMAGAQVTSCASAVSDLLAEANFNSNIILPKIWREFIADARLREGVRQAALIMIERMKSQKQGTVFADLALGFQRAGLNSSQASDATWKTLALYGNGGPNMAYRLVLVDLPTETSHLKVGFSIIGSAISYLNYLQVMKGKPNYAYPPEVTGCLSPKPYHFWLNAYFSRWLVQKGYSPSVAQLATFIVAKGYQMHRGVNSAGGGVEKLLTKSSDHPTNQVVRMDLVLAAAGDVYGTLAATNQKIKPMNLNLGLEYLRGVRGENTEVSTDWLSIMVTPERVRAYSAWDKIFKPNKALEYFQSGQ